MWTYNYTDELYHHGVRGMHWGQRKYQYADGSLTPAGKRRYYTSDGQLTKAGKKWNKKIEKEEVKSTRKRINDEVKQKEIREKTLKTKSAQELYKHYDLLSQDEINDVEQRIQNEHRLKSLSENEKINNGKNFTKSITSKIDNFTSIASSTQKAGEQISKLYDLYARYENAKSINSTDKFKGLMGISNDSLQYTKYFYGENKNNQKAKESNNGKSKKNKIGGNSNPNSSTASNNSNSSSTSKNSNSSSTSKNTNSSTASNNPNSSSTSKNSNSSSTSKNTNSSSTYKVTYKDVFGKGTSKYSGPKYYTFDDDYRDIKPSTANTGSQYINRFLIEDKHMNHSDGDADELYHHGVKGQKWGVRRYQNKDGSLTSEGKIRVTARNNIIRNRQYTDDVNDIVSTLSTKEKKLLGAELDKDWIEKEYEIETISNKAKTFVTKIGDTPVSALEIWTNGGRTGQISIATRNDPEFRGKGYASKEVERAIKWVDRYGNKSIDELEWWAEKSNAGSRRLAEKHGFKEADNRGYDDWVRYTREVKNK